MAKRALLLVVLMFVGCSSGSSAQQSAAPPAPPLRPAAGIAHADWLKQWQAALPAAATLHRGEHRGEVAGNFFSRVKVVYPVFNTPIHVENRTGHRLTTGTDLYVVQTASGASGKDNIEVLEVIGGAFKQSPPEDYVGSVEVRGGKATPEVDFGLVDSLDANGRHGFFGGALDVLLAIGGGEGNILDHRFTKASSFGEAAPGKSLSIETDDLQLTVRVRGEYEGSTYVVSPAMQFASGKGDPAAFRYIFRFERGAATPAESVLIALDDTHLLPMAKDETQPLWKRVFAAGWAGQLTSPESITALASLAAIDGRQPVPIRQAALLSLGRRRASFEVIRAIAENKKEPTRLRATAAWALRTSADPNAPGVLRALLNESDALIKARAIDALVELKATDAVEPLLALLHKREAEDVRSNIVAALGELGDQTTAASLSAMAKKNSELRRLVIPVLAKTGKAMAVPALTELYAASGPKGPKDEDWPARMDVCASLASIDDAAALALLQKAVGDPHTSVRTAAVRSIASVASAERRSLVLSLVDNPDKETATSAIRALGTNQSPEAKARILDVLKNTAAPKEVRWAAIDALSEYADTGMAKALLALLPQETDSNLKADLLSGLSLQSGPDARTAIERGIRDPDSYVAGRAARLWRKLNGIKACPATVDALVARKDGKTAERYVNTLTLPGCRDRASFEKVAAGFGTGDASYDGELARLLKSWSGQDLATDKVKWLAWAKEHVSF